MTNTSSVPSVPCKVYYFKKTGKYYTEEDISLPGIPTHEVVSSHHFAPVKNFCHISKLKR